MTARNEEETIGMNMRVLREVSNKDVEKDKKSRRIQKV